MKYEATDTAFVTALKDVRRNGTFSDAVLTIFGEFYSREEAKAILIHLVNYLPLTPDEQDIVLESWGLLVGYTEIASVTERKNCYIHATGYNGNQEPYDVIARRNLNQDRMKSLRDSLVKYENRLYAKMDREFSTRIKNPERSDAFTRSALKAQYDKTNEVALIPLPSHHKSKESPSGNYGGRNVQFIGRDDILAKLFDNFFNEENPKHIQALYGMAGVGKSSIALEYIHRYRGAYGLVWRIDATNEETLIKSCEDLLKRKIGEGNIPSSPSAIINCFLEYIEKMTNRLLVIDNADAIFEESTIASKLIDELPTYRGHTLITTRNSHGLECMHMIPVDLFDPDTSVQYLVNITGKKEDKYTRILAKRLENLPLALTYAGSYINQHTDYKGYLELWDQTGLKLWDQKDGHYADRTVRQAFDITLNRIKEDLPDENAILLLELLYVCASFEAEYFPVDAFLEYERSMPDDDVNLLDLVKSFGSISSTAINLEDGKRYWIKYYVKDDHAVEARWDNGPQNGEIVPGNCIRETRDHLIPTLENIIERNELIAKLEGYSLIEVFNGNLKMHPLLREIIRDEEYYTDVPRIKPVSPNYGFTSKVYEFAGDLETASKLKYKHLEFWLSIEGSLIGLPSSENDGYLLTSSLSYRNELFQALLKYGSSELIRYYINLRRARIEGALDNDDTYPYAIQLLLTEDNFYNELSIRLGRRIIYRVYNNPEKVRNTGKEYSIFMTRKSNLGTSVAPSDDPAYAAITVVFDDMSMVPNILSEILSDKTWKWQSIALPAEFNDETLYNAVINRVSKDHGIKFL